MRINKYVAQATGISRRGVDKLIEAEKIIVNGSVATAGQNITEADEVVMAGKSLQPLKTITIVLNKPVGYVCSRNGQGSKTVYDLLPKKYHHLKPVGRLDKDSSGLLPLTNDGTLANTLTHPSFEKTKVYEVILDKNLTEQDKIQIEQGVELEDGVSALELQGQGKTWTVTMHEGRNRQIRRTFAQLNYRVEKLNRIQFGEYILDDLSGGGHLVV